jgi:DNA-binding MarR family transcriptional regulator
MDLRNCINYLLTVAQHEVFQLLSERLAHYGITPGQYGVLNCLWKSGELSPKEIAQTLCLETSTISGVLDRMQKKGLIDRFINPDDRRVVRVSATPAGEALKEDVLRTVEEVNKEILSRFDPENVALLSDILRQIGKVD